MKRIFLSLSMIVACVGVIASATLAYFNDGAVLGNNTYATGILDIRVDGEDNATGFSVTGQYPGAPAVSHVFSLQNYGAPSFAGPSTLSAKDIIAKSQYKQGDGNLFNSLEAKLFVNAGWGGCSNASVEFVAGKGCKAFDGLLKDLSSVDLMTATQWGTHAELIPGNSWTMTLDVELPDTLVSQNTLMGKTTTFDLAFDGYTSVVH